MKKTIALLLALVLCLSLCACKNKNVKAVDDLILSIGEGPYTHEDVILQAEAAYNALTEKEQTEVENSELLESIRESYEQSRKEYFDAAISTIEDFFKAGDMELAESLCYDVLNNEQTPPREDEIPAINEWLDKIYDTCFAGTYIAMPEYVSGVLPAAVAGDDTIEELFDGRNMYVSYDYTSSLEVLLVFNQYKAYFDSKFNYITSDYNSNGSVKTYYYADDSNRQIMLQLFDFSPVNVDIYSINIEMVNTIFDRTKLETSDMSLTIRDTDRAVKRK